MKNVAPALACLLLTMQACSPNAKPASAPDSKEKPVTAISEEEYAQIRQRIIDRIIRLTEKYPSLKNIRTRTIDPTSNNLIECTYNMTWRLQDPTKKHSRMNAKYPVFGKGGYSFHLTIYRGQWEGQAVFYPIEFDDLKIWFDYEAPRHTPEIDAISQILKEEHNTFLKKHPENAQ